MAHQPPKAEEVGKPPSKEVLISNKDFSGLRGCAGRTHILQSDRASNPGISIQAQGNIYLDAASRMQQTSDVCVQSVRNRLIQYIHDIEKHVTGQVFEHIQGPISTKVNTDRTDEIVGKYILDVAGPQETFLGSGQLIDVTGSREIKVSADQKVTASGSIVEVAGGSTMALKGASATLSVGSNSVEVKSDGKVTIKGSAAISIEGGDITIKGGKVDVTGKGDVTIKGGKVNVTGSMVKINS